MSTIAKIIVGTDGSSSAQHAVDWAVRESTAHGATLEIIHSWSLPLLVDPTGMSMVSFPVEDLRRAAEQVLNDAVSFAKSKTTSTVTGRVAQGIAANVLIDASQHADLVVVGSRGHGGFVGLLLGSVAQQVAMHSRCPVVVVPSIRD